MLRPFTVKLSTESADGWKRYSVAQGVSKTALIEAIGRHLADDSPPRSWPDLVAEARAIDAERRLRH